MISGLRQTSDMQDMETQASPSLLSIRQSDLKIIIDDFPEDQMKPSTLVKKQSYLQFITKMIEKIKSLARRKKVSGNINEYNTCHSCHGLLERNLLICCSIPDCQRYFCLRCLNKKFAMAPEDIYEISTSSSWNCFSCRGCCNCKMYAILVSRLLLTNLFPFLPFWAKSYSTLDVRTVSLERVKNFLLN